MSAKSRAIMVAIADAFRAAGISGELVVEHDDRVGSSVTWIGAPGPDDIKVTVKIEPLSKTQPPSARGT